MLHWPTNERTNSQIEKLNLSAVKPMRNMEYSPNLNQFFNLFFNLIQAISQDKDKQESRWYKGSRQRHKGNE